MLEGTLSHEARELLDEELAAEARREEALEADRYRELTDDVIRETQERAWGA